jgi:hypothetical protein
MVSVRWDTPSASDGLDIATETDEQNLTVSSYYALTTLSRVIKPRSPAAIHKDLEPFWGLSPAQIEARRTELLRMANSDHLLRLTIRNGSVGDEDGPASTKIWCVANVSLQPTRGKADGRPSNKLYYQLFQGFSEALPDMNITINMYDQPMGFVSWEERQRLIDADRKGICE